MSAWDVTGAAVWGVLAAFGWRRLLAGMTTPENLGPMTLAFTAGAVFSAARAAGCHL
jgi:hypothetical protein